MRSIVAIELAALLALVPAIARANDPAMAEALFQEGKRLMNAGDYAAACPRLAESHRLDPGTGVLLALAICHESEGKTASAWGEFINVASAAKAEGRADREQIAKKRIAALEPKLSRLTIEVPAALAETSGLQIKRNGIEIGRAGWSTAVPVDPGDQTIEVTAPGKKRWSTMAKVGAAGQRQSVTLPAALEDEPVAQGPSTPPPRAQTVSPPPAAPEQPAPPRKSTTTLGLVIGGAGVLLLGAGTYFGITALSKRDEANTLCPVPASCTNPDAIAVNDEGKTAAHLANVGIGLGIVGLAIGSYLVLSSPSPAKTGVRVAPSFARGGGGLWLHATY